MLALASQQSQLVLISIALVFGLVVGILGHLSKSRTLVITGILVIGLVSAYFSFVLQPGGHM